MKNTIPQKIPALFSRPKKIPASFIDPEKSLLAKMSDPKKSFGPLPPPSLKYVSGAPGHVNLHCVPHNIMISQFSLSVCCHFMYGKVLENVEALLSLFSKYKLFVYGIELWTQKRHVWFISCLILICGLELTAINDAPVKQCILFRSFRFDGNLFKLISR